MQTLELKKHLKHLYQPSARQVEVVDVPEMQFLMIDGAIEPGQMPGNSPAFQQAVSALYGAAYTLKFMSKQRPVEPIDYPVMALEGLWWVEDGKFDIRKADNWHWRLLMMHPDHIGPEMFSAALAQLRKKKGDQPAFGQLRLERFREGLCVQVLHIGPYASEPETVATMQTFAAENGYRMRGMHHEIYLGDPLRSAPEKLKTVLRHPVEKNA